MRLRPVAASLAALFLSTGIAHANLVHTWSHRYNEPDDQYVSKMVLDPFGNIIVCGTFYTSLEIDQVYPSLGFQDAYVAKFDASGNVLWVHQLGDVRPDQAFDVTTDVVGNVICVGHLSSAMNDQDAMIVKYAPDGTLRWLKRFGQGDMHYESAQCVSTNPAKEILVAGEFDAPMNLGGTTLQPTGGVTFFMAKFDQNGNHVWSKAFLTSTPYAYNLSGLRTGSDGQSLFTGVLLDSLDLGNGVMKCAGDYDIFLARFDANGNALWSKRYGDAQLQEVGDIELSPNGLIGMVGATNGTVNFGGGDLIATGDIDPVVAVLNASTGNQVWAKIYNGSSNQYASALTWASNSDLLFVCRGSGTLDFGGGPQSIAGPVYAVWLARVFGGSGSYRWSTTMVSTGGMDAQVEENSGKIYLVGGVGGDMNFGGGMTTGEPDYFDLYVARYDDVLTGVGMPILQSLLGQNVPNPFNPRTTIPYTLVANGRARIEIYSVSGAVVTVLDGGMQAAGAHALSWDGRDHNGKSVASGVYFYRLEGSAEAPHKMVLLK